MEPNDLNKLLNELESQHKEIKQLSKAVAQLTLNLKVHNAQSDIKYWQLYKKDGESDKAMRERFFLNMPKAEGRLRIAQLAELEIMKFIHNVCIKNNISYWLNYGTLIGAIRHNSFIPWDDDMDICMLREDYEKFAKCIKNDPDFEIRHLYVEFYGGLAHFIRVYHKKINACFVDIFTYDKVNDTSDVTYQTMKQIRADFRKGSSKYFNKNLTTQDYEKIFNDVYRDSIKKVATSKNLTAIIWSIDNCVNQSLPILELKDIFPLKQVKFEGNIFYAPNNYNGILEKIYGDIYTLPNDLFRRHINTTDDEIKLMKTLLLKID